MSAHKECGEEIRWGRLESDHDRYMPPLEFAGTGFIFDSEGVAIQVQVYRRHVCDPEKVRAWQQRIAELEELGVGRHMPRLKVDIEPDETDEEREERRAEREAAWAQQEARYQAAREARREKINGPAMMKPCPLERCGALVGEMCVNLSEKAYGRYKETANCHEARQAAARKAGHYPESEAIL